MKNTRRYLTMVFSAMVLSMLWSCSATMYSSTGARFTDDLYATHDKQAIAKQVAVEREQARAAAEAAAQAAREYERESGNPYQDILADDYESAYARRLKGFESPTYRMPSSYYNFRYGNDAGYASAYDPSFYNVMVMGDEVWVEPKYVTSMFGTWGSPVNVNLNFGFGSGWGNSYWGNSWWGNSYWGNPYYGWNNPYYGWGYPSWGGGYPGWGYPHWGGHYPHWGGHYPSWGGHYYDRNTSYRPSYSRYPYNGSSGSSSSGYRRPSKYSSGSGTSSSGNRRPNSSGNSTYRDRYDKSPSTTTRPSNNQPSTRPTYTPPASTYPSGGGSSSGGSSSGGSYGGSSSRGGGSRGR